MDPVILVAFFASASAPALRRSVTDGREAPERRCQGTQSASETPDMCVLTPRSSGRAQHKVLRQFVGTRATQLKC